MNQADCFVLYNNRSRARDAENANLRESAMAPLAGQYDSTKANIWQREKATNILFDLVSTKLSKRRV